MRRIVAVTVLLLALALPGPSYGFGILRYAYDAIANQFGFDRGPIPKAPPREYRPGYAPARLPGQQAPEAPTVHIQAEGF